jgi:hypothetical protein
MTPQTIGKSIAGVPVKLDAEDLLQARELGEHGVLLDDRK